MQVVLTFIVFIALAASAAARTPVAGFKAYGGEWRAVDGVLHGGGGAGPKLVCDAAGFAVGEVGVEVFFPDKRAGNAGFIVKVGRPGVGADRFDGYEISLDVSGQFLRLGRHRQNFQNIKDSPCPVPVKRWIPLVVRLTERTLEVLVDGKRVIQYEDKQHPLTSGRIGLRQWRRPARYRNLWIKTKGETKKIPFAPGAPEAIADPNRDWPATLALEGLPPIACVTRHPLSRPNAIACDIWQSQPRAPGCGIRVFDPTQPRAPARVVFRDDEGCIYDMNVSFDARTLYFSYRGKDEKHWQIWRIDVDGTNLEQLTSGPHYNISPAPLPDGDIVFVSTRRGGYTVCQPGPASNLHRMKADGSDVRCVSMNTLSDFSPQLLPDGRVLFSRWEYVDRDLTYRQSLWTQNPDGTNYQLYFGNTVRDVGSFWQARPLPGSNARVVATFAPHHGWPHGAIGLIDRRGGPEGPKGEAFTYITTEFPSIRDSAHEWSYRDPYPLSDETFLCAYGAGANRYRIVLLDAENRKRLLYEDPELGCYFPLPLKPAPAPPVVASQLAPYPEPNLTTTADSPTGTFLLVDVYRGLEPTIERGQVKAIRVMEQVRKSEDLHSRAYDESPVMGYGTYYAKRSWGTAPVLADGSAHFKAPALREIYFQALDAEGRELQRMTSAAQLMPGERQSCIGCHEPRGSAHAPDRPPLAARRPAVELEPPAWGNDGIVDFVKLVQPVLDKYCVECHGGGDPAGGCDLTGDKTRYFNMAYDNLLGRARSYRQHNMDTGEMLPEERAKGKPLVHFFWLLRTPTAVNQPLWTGTHASRLPDYLTAEHVGREMPLAVRQRIYLWIDANVPYYGTYAHSRPKSPGKRDLFTDAKTGRRLPWFEKDFLGAYNRRCAGCHGKYNAGTTDWEGRFAWINLSRPQHSSALTAHLAKSAGGRGIGKTKDGKPIPPFADAADPDYRTMLEAIETGKKLAGEHPAADMPGFAGHRREP